MIERAGGEDCAVICTDAAGNCCPADNLASLQIKSDFIFMRFTKWFLLGVLFVAVLTGCGEAENVQTDASQRPNSLPSTT
jgi:hypothetical protein